MVVTEGIVGNGYGVLDLEGLQADQLRALYRWLGIRTGTKVSWKGGVPPRRKVISRW